jgi:GNAT superfamily N-acetyltransferase
VQENDEFRQGAGSRRGMKWIVNPKSGLLLRSYQAADLDSVTSLVERGFKSYRTAEEVCEMLCTYVKTGADRVPLAEQLHSLLHVSYYLLTRLSSTHEEILGITGLYRPVWAGVGSYWLGWFAADARFQGQGYGIVLLKKTMQIARANGGRLLCVETSREFDPALKLYERMGFRECGEVPDYWASGSSLVILTRALDNIPIPNGVLWNE